MAYTGMGDGGNTNNQTGVTGGSNAVSGKSFGKPKVLGARRLFDRKNPGSPGKLGKTSTKAESLSKLRGKGAIA